MAQGRLESRGEGTALGGEAGHGQIQLTDLTNYVTQRGCRLGSFGYNKLMYVDTTRVRLIRQAWKAVGLGRFADKALIEAAVLLGDEPSRPTLRQALPAVWLQLDAPGDTSDWITVTGLDGEAIDALQTAVGAGLPERGKKAGLHAYALRPADFPALLFLAFVAARLATPYVDDGSHRKVRDQFWYAPELVIILTRCLPPKLGLLAVEQVLRIILQAPSGWAPPALEGDPGFVIGQPPSPYSINETTMGMIEFPEDEKEDE